MTDALVSSVVKELGAIVKDEVGLLASVKKELKSLSSTFSAIQALLVDAERKQVTTEGVQVWLGKIKEVAYEVDDILDEWRIDAFMSQHDEDEDDIGKIQKCIREYGRRALKLNGRRACFMWVNGRKALILNVELDVGC